MAAELLISAHFGGGQTVFCTNDAMPSNIELKAYSCCIRGHEAST